MYTSVLDVPGHHSDQTLHSLEKPYFFVYPPRSGRKRVASWTFLFVCVRLGHGYMRNQVLSQINTRFTVVSPRQKFSPLSAEMTREIVGSVKPVTPWSRFLDIWNTLHTCICMVCHNLGFGGLRTLRGTTSTKPYTRWKNPNVFVYPPPRSGRKRVAQWTFLFVCVRLEHVYMGNQIWSQINTLALKKTHYGCFRKTM